LVAAAAQSWSSESVNLPDFKPATIATYPPDPNVVESMVATSAPAFAEVTQAFSSVGDVSVHPVGAADPPGAVPPDVAAAIWIERTVRADTAMTAP
jgi:hypothetical protein